MLRVVIKWTYYKENRYFSSWNARQKKDCVFFYDYDEYIGYIIQNMSFSDLQKLRLNIYNKYHKLIKFTAFGEVDLDWNKFEWYKLESPIIEIDNTDFVNLLPNSSIRKNYFDWDSVREKYILKWKFINYVQLNVV